MASKKVNIMDVCSEVFAGGDAPKNRMAIEKTSEYTIPIYSNGEDRDGLYGYTNFARVSLPSITVSARGTIGYASIRKEPFVPIVRLITITPISELIDIHYLYYAIKNFNFSGSGTSIPQLTVPMIKQYNFPLPPLEEQHKIASVLDKVSDLIAKRRQQLDKLDELVKSRFVEMFGDPVSNSKCLPTERGRDFFKLSNGKFVPETKRFESGIPAYGGNGISWYTDDAILQNDTLVVGRVGFQSGNVHFAKGPLWITDNAMYISNYDQYKYNLLFLWALMEHIDFTRFQDAGDLKKITQKPFMSMEYICPTLSQQLEYVSFVEQTEKTKTTISHSLQKLETLKKALMQEYFG